jgi:hypothetical protein
MWERQEWFGTRYFVYDDWSWEICSEFHNGWGYYKGLSAMGLPRLKRLSVAFLFKDWEFTQSAVLTRLSQLRTREYLDLDCNFLLIKVPLNQTRTGLTYTRARFPFGFLLNLEWGLDQMKTPQKLKRVGLVLRQELWEMEEAHWVLNHWKHLVHWSGFKFST